MTQLQVDKLGPEQGFNKKYRVELSALAVVRQVHYVDAPSPKAAEEIAQYRIYDQVWQYYGLADDDVRVEATTEVR